MAVGTLLSGAVCLGKCGEVMALLPEPLGVERKLSELRAAHRALDARIEQLVDENFTDQIEMQRLKKQKLALRDVIVRLESHMLPDIIA